MVTGTVLTNLLETPINNHKSTFTCQNLNCQNLTQCYCPDEESHLMRNLYTPNNLPRKVISSGFFKMFIERMFDNLQESWFSPWP